MIAKEHIGRGLNGTDRYITLKPGAELICTNMGGDTPQQRAIEWRALRSARPQLTRVSGHLILSHSPDDRALSKKEWEQAVRTALKEKGAADAAFLAYRHPPDEDHDHDHVHVLYCRILPNGEVVSDSNSYKKNEAAARAIERELKLEPPRPRPPSQSDGDRRRVDNANRRATRRGTPLARPADFHARLLPALKSARSQAELFELLAAASVEAQLAGGGWKLRAVGAEEWLSGTTVHRSMSWGRVEKMLSENAARAPQETRARPAAAHLLYPEVSNMSTATAAPPAPIETPGPATPFPGPAAPAPSPAPAPAWASAQAAVVDATAAVTALPTALQRELQGMETLDLHNLQRHALQLPMPLASTDLLVRLRELLRKLVSILFKSFQDRSQAVPSHANATEMIVHAVEQELDRRAARSPRTEPAIQREAEQVDEHLRGADAKAAQAMPAERMPARAKSQAFEDLQLATLRQREADAAAELDALRGRTPKGPIAALSGASKRHAEAVDQAQARHSQAAAELTEATRARPEAEAAALSRLQAQVEALQRDVRYWRQRAARLDNELRASRAVVQAAVPEGAEKAHEEQDKDQERHGRQRER